MAERDPVDLLKDQLNRWEGLAGLHPDSETFKQWHAETRTILEKAFSPKSSHVQNFLALKFREVSVKAFASPEISRINSARYKRDLESAKNILQSSIKELTLDRTLFKKIQTTPKTVEVSLKGEYFTSGVANPETRSAIQSAFDGSELTLIQDSEVPRGEDSLDCRMDRIKRARFGIYDLTSPEREDVLFEIGIAIGMGKKVTIIYKKGTLLPEIIKKMAGIEYENLSDLAEKLRREIV